VFGPTRPTVVVTVTDSAEYESVADVAPLRVTVKIPRTVVEAVATAATEESVICEVELDAAPVLKYAVERAASATADGLVTVIVTSDPATGTLSELPATDGSDVIVTT
jgi:hypothetical protein